MTDKNNTASNTGQIQEGYSETYKKIRWAEIVVSLVSAIKN
jgi:hypothetical protein